MNGFSWPVTVLAVVALLAGAVVGEGLRSAVSGTVMQPQAVVMAGTP
jgi:hypothetical protein